MNIYDQITNQIIEQLETAQQDTWDQPWISTQSLPHNLASGHQYTGINLLVLLVRQARAGYQSSAWLTYKQARDLGGHVKAGEKATAIVYYGLGQTKELDETGNEQVKTYRFPKVYSVFNQDQTSLKSEIPLVKTNFLPKEYEKLPINLELGEPSYNPETDTIKMPPIEHFKSHLDYFATLSHELIHWTGHSSRLNRNLAPRFAKDRYAAEELIAELGSIFLCAHYGIERNQKQHNAYLASWLRLLKQDNKAIFTAAAHAQRALNFIVDLMATNESVKLAA